MHFLTIYLIYDTKIYTQKEVYMKKLRKILGYLIIPLSIIFICFLVLHRGVLTESKYTGEKYAQDLGYTSITIDDISKFIIFTKGCSIKDSVQFKMSALDHDGNKFQFTICSGWPFKNPTMTKIQQNNDPE